MNKLITIIVPIYKTEQYLERCFESLRTQSHTDIEVLMVNDGSPDNSFKICQEYENKDSRFKYIFQENSGVSSARNNGIVNAKGGYVCFVDSDDSIDKDYCKKLYEELINNNCDICFAGYYEVNRNNKKEYGLEPAFFSGVELRQKLMPLFLFSPSNTAVHGSICRCIFKKCIIDEKKICFDENLKYSEDLIFLLSYLNNAKAAVFISEKLYLYYNNEDSVTNNYVKNLSPNLILIKEKLTKIFNESINDSLQLNYTLLLKFSEFLKNEAKTKNNIFKTLKIVRNTAKAYEFSKLAKRLKLQQYKFIPRPLRLLFKIGWFSPYIILYRLYYKKSK